MDIIGYFKAADVKNTVWISADVHFATAFEYPEWAENFPEVVVGPFTAGLFPKGKILSLNEMANSRVFKTHSSY